jgi:uncharacterized membrane protein YeiB
MTPTLGHAVTTSRTGKAARIDGLDVARALAILGMMVTHYVPYVDPRWRPQALLRDTSLAQEALFGLPAGRASALFVVLAGISLTLLTRSAEHPVANVVRRASLLAALGLLLLPAFGGMILHLFAVWFLAALLFRKRSDRTLIVAAITLLPLGWFAATALDPGVSLRSRELLDPVVRADEFWPNLALTHPSYPAVLWFSLVLFGMWLGRHPLRDRRWQAGLLAGGLAAAVACPLLASAAPGDERLAALFSAVPHSLGFPYLLGAAGSASAVIGACLLAAGALPRLLSPLAATGRLSLTLYVAHLVPFWLWFDERWDGYHGHPPAAAVLAPTAIFGAFVLAAVVWTRRFDRGPLEAGFRIAASWTPVRAQPQPARA